MELQKTFKGTNQAIQYMVQYRRPTFIKWAGGKTQLLSQYEKLFPEKFNNYFEPFLGGGAVFFYIKQRYNPKACFLSDVNEDLINTFVVVRNEPELLISLLKEHANKDNSRQYFNKQRDIFNNKKSKSVERAALFIYLNKTCFNGLYRVNGQGKFNVPFGKYKKPAIVQEDKIMLSSELLRRTKLEPEPFSHLLGKVSKDDFLYFDPPYVPLSKSASFTSYQKHAFLEKEQRELAKMFKKLDEKGCFVMLSNSDTPLISELYSTFNLKKVKARRSINCVGDKRGLVNEIVVTNY